MEEASSSKIDSLSVPEPNAQARAVFDQHHQEIKRRSNVATSNNVNSTSFSRAQTVGATDFPFELPDQDWVLYSVSHVRFSPVADDPCNPGIRVYGTFATPEDATDHARLIVSIDQSVNVQLSRARDWFSLISCPERLQDDGAVREHVKTLLADYNTSRDLADTEFNSNLSKNTGGKGQDPWAASKVERRKEEAAKIANTLGEDGQAKRELRRAVKLGRAAEVRDQNVVVISFVADNTQALPEPLVCVWGAFNTETEADVYVRNTCGETVKDHDLYVCALYEWLHPQNIDVSKLRNELFRSKELTSVIQNHKSQPAQCDAYSKWRNSTTPSKRIVTEGASEEDEQVAEAVVV